MLFTNDGEKVATILAQTNLDDTACATANIKLEDVVISSTDFVRVWNIYRSIVRDI